LALVAGKLSGLDRSGLDRSGLDRFMPDGHLGATLAASFPS